MVCIKKKILKKKRNAQWVKLSSASMFNGPILICWDMRGERLKTVCLLCVYVCCVFTYECSWWLGVGLGHRGKIPWSKKWQPTPTFLPVKSHRGAWWATVHGIAKSQTRLRDWTTKNNRADMPTGIDVTTVKICPRTPVPLGEPEDFNQAWAVSIHSSHRASLNSVYANPLLETLV